MHGFKFEQTIGRQLVRDGRAIEMPRGVVPLGSELRFSNIFAVQHFRKGRLLGVVSGHNDIVIEGKNHVLDVCFGNSTPVTQVDPWYQGLINQTPTPVLSESDTLASHAGWAEFSSYSGNRQAWTDANAASKVKGTTTISTFTMTAGGEIHGIFVASVATGTSGILWATGAFDSSLTVVTSDELKITYGIRC